MVSIVVNKMVLTIVEAKKKVIDNASDIEALTKNATALFTDATTRDGNIFIYK